MSVSTLEESFAVLSVQESLRLRCDTSHTCTEDWLAVAPALSNFDDGNTFANGSKPWSTFRLGTTRERNVIRITEVAGDPP